MCIWKKNYVPEKLVWPPDPREAFYLTILQAELRVTTLLTTLCIDGWGASGGGLTDLILRCWSIGKSKPFKEIISPFHRRLLLNLMFWRIVCLCEELVGDFTWRVSDCEEIVGLSNQPASSSQFSTTISAAKLVDSSFSTFSCTESPITKPDINFTILLNWVSTRSL